MDKACGTVSWIPKIRKNIRFLGFFKYQKISILKIVGGNIQQEHVCHLGNGVELLSTHSRSMQGLRVDCVQVRFGPEERDERPHKRQYQCGHIETVVFRAQHR